MTEDKPSDPRMQEFCFSSRMSPRMFVVSDAKNIPYFQTAPLVPSSCVRLLAHA